MDGWMDGTGWDLSRWSRQEPWGWDGFDEIRRTVKDVHPLFFSDLSVLVWGANLPGHSVGQREMECNGIHQISSDRVLFLDCDAAALV